MWRKCLAIVFLIAVSSLLLRLLDHGEAPVTYSSSAAAGVERKSSPASAVTRALPAARPREEAASGRGGLEPALGFHLHRELDRRWLEPSGKAGRLRERLVETDFKYPLLRLEERVSETAPPTVEFIRAMVANHVLAGLHERADADAVSEHLAREGMRGTLIDRTLMLVQFADRRATFGALDELIAKLTPLDEFIDFAEPDWLVHASAIPNDPLWPQLWGLHNPGQTPGAVADADIDAPEGWEVRTGASEVVVAVIDTGARLTHEDLLPNLWINADEIAGNGLDDDDNYVVDDVHGYNALDDGGDPTDDSGHGTHVAGTIGACGNNGLGGTGVAWEVQLMPIKSLAAAGSGTTSDAIRAINYARFEGADLINASWGGFGRSEGLFNAIAACRDAGVIFVTAAGNETSDNDSTPHYPSSYPLSNIVSVASSTPEDTVSSFSNTGRYSVDLAAPGSGITSCWFTHDSEYRTLDGTSMAAPHVTGALALALAEFPADTMSQSIARLLGSIDPLAGATGKLAAPGRLNLQRLLTAPVPPLVPNDTVAGAHLLEGPYGLWVGSNADAVSETGDRLPPDSGNRSLWFRWEAPGDGLADWRVSSSTETSGHDLRILVFDANPAGHPSRLVIDSGSVPVPGPAVARHYVQAGDEFLVAVDSHSPSGLDLVLEMGLRPEHDFLARALNLPGGPFLIEDDNRNASAEPFEIDNPHAGVGSGRSLWYRWTVPEAGEWVVHTAGSQFDTVLAIYRGDRSNSSSLTELASNDDRSSFDQTSSVTISPNAGEELLIAVDSYRAASAGALVLSASKVGELVIFRHPEPLVLPLGSRAAFHVTAGGGETVRYQWFLDDEPIPGATRASYVIEAIEPEDFGEYHVELSNGIDFLRSDPATLAEERSAPVIVQTTGNLFLATGSNATLSVTARGSQPLSYEWSLDGATLPNESSSSLALNSIETSQAGLYTCRVSNDLGEATATIRLTIVDTPFSGWEYRIASQPNATITDLVVHDGTCYAVAGHRLLASTDGIEWNPIPLPPGFVGHSLVRFNSQWLCYGPAEFIYDGLEVQIDPPSGCVVAVSPDLQSWSIQQSLGLREPVRNVVELDGRLVGWANGRISPSTRPIVYSNDGITWQNIRVQFLGGGTANEYNLTAPFGVGDGFLLASGRVDSPTGQATILRSTDGMQWQEILLPPHSDGPETSPIIGFGVWDGRLWATSSRPGAYATSDGIAWTFHASESGVRPGGFDFHDDYVNMVILPSSALEYQWTPSIFDGSVRRAGPFPGDTFTAAIPFDDRVVYGTTRGVLHSVRSPQEIMAVDRRRSDLFNLIFLNGQFLCADRQGNFYTSSDGIEWTLQRNLIGNEDEFPQHFAGGLYWGRTHDNRPVTGVVPNYLIDERPRPGLAVAPTAMIDDGASILATSDGRLVRSTDNGETWTPTATHLEARNLHHFGDDWFCWARPAGSDDVFVYYHSLDSLSWTSTNLSTPHLVARGDGFFALERRNSTYTIDAWQSTDGIIWTQVPINADSALPEGDIGSIVEFGDTVIAWIQIHPGNAVEAYFTHDGRSWIRAPFLPESIVGKGQLVALGGLQTSTPGAPAELVYENLFLARFDTDDPDYPSWVREGAFREDAENEWGGEQVGDRLLGINARPSGGTVGDRGRSYLDLTAAAGLTFEPNTSYFIDLLIGHRPGFEGNQLEWGLWSGVPGDLNNEPSLGTTGLADPTNVPFNQLVPADQTGLPNQTFTFQTGLIPPSGPMILFVRNRSFNGGRVYLDEIELRSVSTSSSGAAPPVTIVSGPPTVRITSSGNRSGVIVDTSVEITGFANDGEDGESLSLSCRVDGIEIATATGGAFSFTVPVTERSGHVVEIVATDTDGLRGSDAIVIETITSDPPNLLGRHAPGTLTPANLTTLGGAFFLQSAGSFLRSYDGLTWTEMPVPSGFGGPLAAGAGRLVSRDVGSHFAFASVDGERWMRAEAFGSTWRTSSSSPLEFAYGFFQTRRFPRGDHLISSADGLNWHFVPDVPWGIRTSEHDFVAYFGSHVGETGLVHSRDGENWHAIPKLAHWARPSEAEFGDHILLTSAAQMQWALSNDHGRTWTLGPTPEPFVDLGVAGGIAFGFGELDTLYATTDGQDWSQCTGHLPIRHQIVGNIPASPIHFHNVSGRYIGHDGTSLVWSDDGLAWKPGEGGPFSITLDSLAGNEEAVVAVFRDGSVWRSSDGVNWFDSLSAPPEFYSGLGWDIDRLGSRLILSGQYDMLFYSDDEGASWTKASEDLAQSHEFFDIEVGAGVALVAASRNQNNRTVLRSVDGANWFEVAPLEDANIFDTATDGSGTWLAVSIRGELWMSSDHGVTWTSIARPAVGFAMALYRQGNEWTIIAAPDRFQICATWTSTDLTSWINRGSTGFSGDFFPVPPRILQAHGAVVFDSDWISFNNRTWTRIAPPGGGVAPTNSGWISAEFWISPVNALSWTQIEQPFAGSRIIEFEGRHFLFREGHMGEWYHHDLALSINESFTPTPGLGVGDDLTVPVTLANLGDGAWSGGELEFALTLSNNSFLGDGDDIPLGSVAMATAVLAPGASQPLDLAVTLPDTLRGGEFHVFVQADPNWLRPDYNGSNNSDRSDAASLEIEEWELRLATTGDGSVQSDSFRRFYPHNFEVPLIALAGKGSVFAGWSGDAVGSQSETSILMTGDRSVTATFATVANLHLTVRGGGSVSGLSSDNRYPVGDTANLEAVPLPGWTFAGWEGDLSGTDVNTSLGMTENRTVIARFVLLLDDWRALHFTPAELADSSVSGDDADPDLDLVPNWREYLHGSNPRDRNETGVLSLTSAGGVLSLQFTRLAEPASGHDLRVTSSRELVDWSAIAHEERLLDTRNGIETVEARLPLRSDLAGFLRFEYFR